MSPGQFEVWLLLCLYFVSLLVFNFFLIGRLLIRFSLGFIQAIQVDHLLYLVSLFVRNFRPGRLLIRLSLGFIQAIQVDRLLYG